MELRWTEQAADDLVRSDYQLLIREHARTRGAHCAYSLQRPGIAAGISAPRASRQERRYARVGTPPVALRDRVQRWGRRHPHFVFCTLAELAIRALQWMLEFRVLVRTPRARNHRLSGTIRSTSFCKVRADDGNLHVLRQQTSTPERQWELISLRRS